RTRPKALRTAELAGAALDEASHSLGGIVAAEDLWHRRAEVRDRSALALGPRGPSVGERRLNTERGLRGDHARDFDRPFKLLPGRHDFLYESDPHRFLGTELVRREQIAHGVTPAELSRR